MSSAERFSKLFLSKSSSKIFIFKLWLALAERYLKRRKVDWNIEKVKWLSEKWRADDHGKFNVSIFLCFVNLFPVDSHEGAHEPLCSAIKLSLPSSFRSQRLVARKRLLAS